MDIEKEKAELESLGYADFFENKKADTCADRGFLARVTAEYKEAYRIKGAGGDFLARITGKQNFQAVHREDFPAVGDWVAAVSRDGEHAVIDKVFPRKTVLKKSYTSKHDIQVIAANINVAFIIESAGRDFNLNRCERYLVLVREGGIKPVIVLNKIDLFSEKSLNEAANQLRLRFPDISLLFTSTKTNQGMGELRKYISKGKTYCFLGSSGVGKSSLINALLKKEEILTREIGEGTGRGKHTTTARQMYLLENGGILIDNPGTRGVGMASVATGIKSVFQDITHMAVECKFPDCSHMHEPGCAIIEAVREGVISEEQYQNFLKLTKENEYFAMTPLEKRKKDRKFGQFIKKFKKQAGEVE